jgi:sensor histidine kinase YesM
MPNWKMGWGLKAMIENNILEEHTLNKIGLIFVKMIEELPDIEKKWYLQQQLQKFEETKALQAQQDKADLKQLDSMLDAF